MEEIDPVPPKAPVAVPGPTPDECNEVKEFTEFAEWREVIEARECGTETIELEAGLEFGPEPELELKFVLAVVEIVRDCFVLFPRNLTCLVVIFASFSSRFRSFFSLFSIFSVLSLFAFFFSFLF